MWDTPGGPEERQPQRAPLTVFTAPLHPRVGSGLFPEESAFQTVWLRADVHPGLLQPASELQD